MTAYHHRENHRHKTRHIRRTHRALYTVLSLIIIVGVAAGVYVWQQSKVEPPIVELKPRAAGAYYGASKKPYTNEIFEFQSAKDWIFSPENSDIPNKYIYYSQTNGLVEYEIRIYLDRESETGAFNYVVPVNVKSGMMVTSSASPLCTTLKKPAPTQQFNTNFGNVNFVCDPNNSRQLYTAGVVGGSYKIPLYDSKGVLRQAIFNFTNHKNMQDASVFVEILENFKLK